MVGLTRGYIPAVPMGAMSSRHMMVDSSRAFDIGAVLTVTPYKGPAGFRAGKRSVGKAVNDSLDLMLTTWQRSIWSQTEAGVGANWGQDKPTILAIIANHKIQHTSEEEKSKAALE